MNVSGIGTDIESIQRIRSVWNKRGQAFLDRVYTSDEQQRAKQSKDPAIFYTRWWAAKEAIYKMISAHEETGIAWKDMEIQDDNNKQCEVKLSGRAKQFAQKRNIKQIHLSITQDTDLIIAQVVGVE